MKINKKQMLCRLFLFVNILFYLASSHPGANAQGSIASEYQVKAAFLYNFLKFVEWPSDIQDSSISVCVLGEDPFGSALDAVKENTVGGKMVAVKRISNLKNTKGCSCVFISSSEKRNLTDILQFVRDSAILTVGDMEGFAEAGGMIGFVIEENKVRFKINIDAVRQGRLNISSKLLRVGYIVGDRK